MCLALCHCIDIGGINMHDSTKIVMKMLQFLFIIIIEQSTVSYKMIVLLKEILKKFPVIQLPTVLWILTRIQKQGKNNFLENFNDDNSIEKVNILDLSIIDPNFHHNQVFIESVDVLDEKHRYNQISDCSLGEFVVSITGHESYNSISSLKRPLDAIGNVTLDVVNYSVKTYFTIKIKVIILVFFILAFIIIFIIVKLCKVCRKNDKNNNKFRSSSVRYRTKEGKVQLFDV
jgi:hypothetical protein